MIKAFDGVILEKHNKVLDELNKKCYKSLAEYIKEIM